MSLFGCPLVRSSNMVGQRGIRKCHFIGEQMVVCNGAGNRSLVGLKLDFAARGAAISRSRIE